MTLTSGRGLRLMVALPARDEEARIGAAVRALTAQRGPDGRPLSPDLYGVLVLVNNTGDDTAGAARAAARESAAQGNTVPVWVQQVTLPPARAHVGGARGLALERAARILEQDGVRADAALATTDADTLVDPQWVAATLAELDAGAGAVAGRILTLAPERAALPAAARRLHLQDTAYRLLCSELGALLDPDPHDPWPRHHQHFGASLAVSLNAYRRVGGLPQRRSLEDVALVEALRRYDVPLRHSPLVRVWTSARTGGRVETGLSSQLREWEALGRTGGPWRVPGAAEVRADALARRALRAAWSGEPDGAALAELQRRWLAPAAPLRAALDAPTLGRALELACGAREAAGLWAARFPAQPLERALAELRAYVTAERVSAAFSVAGRSSSASRYCSALSV